MNFSRALIASFCFTIVLSACSGRADPPQPADTTPPPPPPTIVAPSVTAVADQTVQVGQTATFSEEAAGSAPLTYQWQKSGTAIAGATAASYTTPATVASDSGSTFTVTVTNSAGSASTQPATLTVTVPVTLTITQQPVDETVAAGSPASFSAGAICSSGTVSWQWQRSNDGGATFADVAGATTATYTLMTIATDNSAEFRARAACGNLTQNTDTATLTVTTTAPTGGLKLTELTPSLALGAQFQQPAGIVFDGTGIAYLTDANNGQIKRVGLDGVVTTLAGGNFQYSSGVDGAGAAAAFNGPRGIARAGDGTLYVTDTLNHTIRKVTTAGVVTTLAGSVGVSGTTDGTGAAARFNAPYGIAVGSDGALYVADTGNFSIRKVTLAGVVTTLAGTSGTAGTADGTGAAARFGLPEAIVADSAGALYVADQANNTIRKVTLAGITTTIAGNGSGTPADAVGVAAGIPKPAGLALFGTTLYIAASGPTSNPSHGQVRQLNLLNGSVTTLTGQAIYNPPVSGFVDGPALTSQFMFDFNAQSAGVTDSVGLAVNSNGLIDITANEKLRQIDSTGLVTTVIGSQVSNANGDGVALVDAAFGGASNAQIGLSVDATGAILVSDPQQFIVRRVTATGAVSTVAGLAGVGGNLTGKGTAAQFNLPDSLVVAPNGTVYVADIANNVVNAIAADGTVTVYAGNPANSGTTDGPKGTALLQNPTSIVSDAAGVVYISDFVGQTIRRIATDGSVTTIAGAPDNGGVDVNGTGSAARFKRIEGLAIDSSGVIYAAESASHTLRKITPAGVVTTLAGGLASDGTPLVANFSPLNLAVAVDGTVYATDPIDDTVLSVSPSGAVAIVAGVVGDNATVTGTNPRLSYPTGIAVLGPKSLALTCIKQFGSSPAIPMSSIYVLTLP